MDNISFKDFQKLDLRIGTVVRAEVPDWSHWVMKLTVDFGDPPAGGGTKTIFAGFKPFFKPKDLEGEQFPFLINLKPKKIGPKGDLSEGMMLVVDGKLDKPILFTLSEKIPDGTKVC